MTSSALPEPPPASSELCHGVPWDTLLSLVTRHARRLHATHSQVTDVSDYESAGLEGLAEAAVSFDPDRNTDFQGYAMTIVTRRMIDLTREILGRTGNHPLPVDLGEDPDPEMLDQLMRATQPPDPPDPVDQDADLRERLAGLSGADMWLAIWYFVDEHRLWQIGEALGITESAVSFRLTDLKDRLAIHKMRHSGEPLLFPFTLLEGSWLRL